MVFSFIQGCQKTVDYWQKMLQVRSLVLSPQENQEAWIKFAALCRKAGRLSLSWKTLMMLKYHIETGNGPGGGDGLHALGGPQTNYKDMSKVSFALAKHQWDANMKDDAFKYVPKINRSLKML